jgi:hypothetical protein
MFHAKEVELKIIFYISGDSGLNEKHKILEEEFRERSLPQPERVLK